MRPVLAQAGLDWEEGGSWAAGGNQKNWAPRQGETVRVLKMGGAPGVVVAAPQGGGGPGRKVGVRVGALTMEVRLADLAPLAAGGSGPEAAKRGGLQRRNEGGSAASSRGAAAKAKEKLRAEGALVAGGGREQGGGSGGVPVAIQTARNTVSA